VSTANHPRFRCYLAGDTQPIETTGALWRRRMPLVLEDVVNASQPHPGALVTYGDYFEAIRVYLCSDHCMPLRRAMGSELLERDAMPPLEEIRIYLEKHGQYYHPARVVVIPAGDPPQTYVVNVALSDAGAKILSADYTHLKGLHARYGYDFLPQVYHCAVEGVPKHDARAMFLGQWLAGYHEFHAGHAKADATCITVWDPATGPRPLLPEQAGTVYRRAAAILTAYYNPYSFEHISNWHHAAGDFVVKAATDQVDVKLITVRSYTPLFQGLGDDPEILIQALVLFMLKLTLRMRLDRLAGTGAMLWLEDFSLAATLRGFWDGLRIQVEHGAIPQDLPTHILTFLQALAPNHLFELLRGTADRFPPDDPGTRLIRENLKSHLEGLCIALDHPDQSHGYTT
jgi:hypothetical protein